MGVVGDVRQDDLGGEPAPGLYVPYQQVSQASFIDAVTFVVRTAGEPRPLAASIRKTIQAVDPNLPVFDIHTHLYDPAFGELLLWGIDDLLTYHYLVAEAFRYLELPPERFWLLPKTQRADLIWDVLFARHSPISEALTTRNSQQSSDNLMVSM